MQLTEFIKKNKKSVSFVVKASVIALFAILLVTMLPAAMPDTMDDADKPSISMPYDDEMPEIDGVARPDLFPHLVIVYPSGDAWGAEEAKHLETRLGSRFHAHFVLVSDSEYLALDEGTLALYNAEPSLTVNLGISSLLGETYLEALSRLGCDGLEIKRDGNRIDLTSVSSLRLRDAIESFVSSLSFDGEFAISEDLYLCDERPSPETDFKPDLISDGEIDILVLSYIDSNPYTLRAIEGIVAHAKPDLVVFNGNIDGSAANRHDLAVLWQGISDALAKTNTPWCFTPGTLGGDLPLITVCEVISSFPGCIRPLSGNSDGSYALTVANSEGIVTASIYVGGDLCERIEADSLLYARASSYKRQVAAILPAIPSAIISKTEGLPADHASKELSDVYDSLLSAGADTFICTADPISTASLEFGDGKLALCGSVGFDSQGLGGRFDYHNSLRGALLLKITSHRADYADAELSYIYAADLGLCER